MDVEGENLDVVIDSSPIIKSEPKDVKPGVISPYQSRVITKRKPEPKLPIPFELPRNYPCIVASDLDKGMLTGKSKTRFISSILLQRYSGLKVSRQGMSTIISVKK